MIWEIAQIEVKPGTESQFEEGVRQARPLFDGAKGCGGLELHRSLEFPQRYRLIVRWETVEDHMVGFRNSESYQGWRALVQAYFAGPPQVEHVAKAV